MKTKNERIGEVNYSKYGSKMTIIKYIDANNLVVQFDNGYIVNTAYKEFKKGNIKNPYDKTVYRIGYLGEGKYKSRLNRKSMTSQYKAWSNMLVRCYNKNYQEKYLTYIGCIVDERWHNFQNFAEWYDENYYEIENEKMCLDKDILYKGNKIYSPETCVFVPQRINSLFTKRQKDRGNLPIGVYYDKRYKKYTVSCSNSSNKQRYLGSFNTPEEAFYTYKQYKEKLIKQTANCYKSRIPQKLYEAMYNYIVEITD